MFNFTYIDPGTGSMLISSAIALLLVVYFALKEKLYILFGKKGEKGESFDLSKHYKLTYYSEGKQYWNVFKPLLEEGSKRSIKAIYLTSDKEDPGLNSNIDGLIATYIGTGREAYYKLNRLKADVVVMTTPGLDVLEIKRSKNVKHYCHITHATSSSGTYKSFSTDYFDSVLVGGEGTHDLIRELEKHRNLPSKNIEIIGHTYLDVYRKNLKNSNSHRPFFKERKPTILVSPTWGDHGLLTKHGDELLSKLCKSKKYNIIVRPHPQSYVSDAKQINNLINKYSGNNIIWDRERENLRAMSNSDIMISDFSGIIFDYYTLFKKPILTITSQYEKRGREAMDLKQDPWDLQILNKIGKIIGKKDIINIDKIIDNAIKKYDSSQTDSQMLNNLIDKYPTESAVRGMDFIEKTLMKVAKPIQNSKESIDSELFNENYTLKNISLKSFFQSIFKTQFIFQALMAGILFLIYTYLGMYFLPKPGLNVEFLMALKFYFMIAVFLIFLIFMSKIWFINKGEFNYNNQKEKFYLKEIGLVLFLLSPIIQYILANQDILTFKDSLLILIIFTLINLFLILFLPTIISPVISKTFSVPVSLSFFFIVLNMASFGRTTSFKIIALVMLLIFVISFFLLYFNKRKILIILGVAFLLSNTVVSLFTLNLKTESTLNTNTSELLDYLESKVPKNTPSIYLMIYDSYPNEETLNSYGIDNHEQIQFLLNKGFAIYDGTYSVGAYSLKSMSQVLNIGYLKEDLTLYRTYVAEKAATLKLFESLDYNNYLMSSGDYIIRGVKPQYQEVYPPLKDAIASYKIISKAIFEGEFRFDVEFSSASREDFLSYKSSFLKRNNEKSEFLYHHTYFPGHSQNSGVLLPDETERFIKRFEIANDEMKQDLHDLNVDTTNAIIIIAGDHGPYLTKNGVGLSKDYDISEVDRLDIQDRFGAFLAILWPDKKYAKKYDISTIQDIFPAIISYMYEEDHIFDEIKMTNKVEAESVISKAGIENGIIIGGKDDGKPLFKRTGVRINKKYLTN